MLPTLRRSVPRQWYGGRHVTALRVLRGNPGKRPINDREPALEPAEGTIPASLAGRAREEWQRLAPDPIAAGVLTIGDRAVFEAYCRIVGDLADIENEIGSVVVTEAIARGFLNYRTKLRAQLKQFAANSGSHRHRARS